MNTAESLKHRLDQLHKDIIEKTLSLMPTANVSAEPIWVEFVVPVQVGDFGTIKSIRRVNNDLFLISQDDEAEMHIADFDDLATLVFIIGELEKADKGQKHNSIYNVITSED